jgi:UPF0755 protein
MKVRITIALVLILVIAAAMVVAGITWANLYRPTDSAQAEIEIPPGLSGRDILDLLHRKDLLPSPLAGRAYLRLAARDRSIRFGRYRFPAGSRPVDVLERILDGRVEMISVTVVEGSDLAAAASQMAAAGIGDEAEWLVMGERVDLIADLMPGAPSLEGFLFPDTYQFAEDIGVEAAARHLVDRFRTVWQEEIGAASDLWGEPYDVVILASLVEAETSLEEERERVAGVYLNRLRRGMLLQCDPTVIFSLKRRGEWTGRLLRIHWGVDDPYNTYRYPGLPPGPINSPGRAAIRAALAPDDHAFLYFVASPRGGHTFSRTLAEHNRAVAVWQRSRR